MTKRLANPLPRDLLIVADELAASQLRGRRRCAAYRRAVSTAYYAVFHAVCYVCVDGLQLWSKHPKFLEPIYRVIDHKTAKAKLTSPEAKLIDPAIDGIGRLFVTLQRARNEADYRPPHRSELTRGQTFDLIDEARRAIDLIETLPPQARLGLSVLIIGARRPN